MDSLDDVVTLAELPQHVFRIPGKGPSSRAVRMRETKRLELAHAADPDRLEVCLPLTRHRPQIDDAAIRRGVASKRFVQSGPALSSNPRLQRMPELAVRARPELQRQKALGPRAHALADVVARNDQIRPLVSPAAHDDMDVGCSVFQ